MPLNNVAQLSCRSLVETMEADCARFRRQAIECPNDLSLWTKLHTVSQIMLSAMREAKVSSALAEICSNLLACEQVAIVEISRATAEVHFCEAQRLSSEMRAAIANQGRMLESQIELGKTRITLDKSSKELLGLSRLGISALVPLWSEQRSSGAMLLFQLLPQRSEFDTEDREILQFLSTHAGPCLRSKSLD